MKRSFALVIGLLAIIAAAFALSFVVGNGGSGGESVTARGDTLPPLDSVLPEDPATPAAADASMAAPSPAQRRQSTADAATDATPEGGFVFTRLEINTGGDEPEACFVFSEALDEDGGTRYGDYLAFAKDDVTPAIRVAGSLLCLGGLDFGSQYTVTLREGLPAAGGARLAYDETVPVELRDRPAAISFGPGLILPRESTDGVPITTVNVDRLKIRVLRVGDRLLSQLQQGLLDERVLYGWNLQDIKNQKAATIWTGEMAVAATRNKTTRTLFPIRQAVPEAEPGAYLVIAEDAADPETNDTYYGGKAAQWIVESDLGLTTYAGNDGLHVFVRSLNTARSKGRVTVTLVARNNEILHQGQTQSDGSYHFAAGLMRGTGGMTPAMVFASDGRDFNFQDLRRAAFDLSDRGVSGRTNPGPVDAYLYLDRGIYRPGETVQLVTMLRDNQATALEDAPLTVIVRRPDGIEYRRQTVNQIQSGASHLPVTLSKSAPRGRWTASAYLDPDQPAVGSVSFDVQDFVPERIEVTLDSPTDYLTPGDDIAVDVTARYLYDAPGANLGGEASLRLVPDADPFEDYQDYDFGLVEERFSPSFVDLTFTPTDSDGSTQVIGVLSTIPATSKPLRADITISLFEPGGRQTRERIAIPVRTNDTMLGIRPGFDGGGVREGADAPFDVIALDRDGARISADNVTWQVIREVVNYQWYQIDGQWRYERIVKDRPVEAGTVQVAADGTVPVSVTGLKWGSYRFEVKDTASGAASSVRFYAGWYGGSTDGRPDRVTVVADKPMYKVGETARLTVRAPMAGRALITVANDRLFEHRDISIPEDGAEIPVAVSRDWGAGAYVMVTVYRPLSDETERAPVRAIGLAHLAVDQSARTLSVDLDAPETAAPQQQIQVPVSVTAGDDGKTPRDAFVTLAAVDTGILTLTNFEPPAPEAHYFGKRRLTMDIRDDYGRLIHKASGPTGDIRSGGDGFANAGGLNVVPTKTVALFSGVVALNDEGQAVIPVTIPDFVGELTLMAVAFSKDMVGHGDEAMTVRRAVVGDMFFPRFLAPGDSAQATLQVNNVDGVAGPYSAVVRTSGALGVTEARFDNGQMEPGQEMRALVSLTGQEPGPGAITLNVTGPEDFSLSRSWDMEVRAPRLAETRDRSAFLEPGTDLTLDATLTEGLIPDTARVMATLGTTPGYDVPALLRALDRYPYGCLEQTTSRAFPLLYFNAIAQQVGIAEDADLTSRIQDAVDRVLDLQTPNGAFGMWSQVGGEANLWLSVFALDFLLTAKESGSFVVPNDAVRRGERWLNTMVGSSWQDAHARAYGFYVLAKQGKARIADLRYFFDAQRADLKNGMSLALLGAALDAAGDRARGRIAFREAALAVMTLPRDYTSIAYGSQARDIAGLTTLAAESGRTDVLPRLFERAREFRAATRYKTTQEKAWMLFAAHRLRGLREGTPLDVTATGVTLTQSDDPMVISPPAESLTQGISIANEGDTPLWYSVSAEGVPAAARPADASGLLATKRVLTMDGQDADLTNTRQSDRYIVVIQGRMEDNEFREMAVLDLLPAGFEIETVLPAGSNKGLYPFLPDLTATQMTSARDDRFIAAFNIGSRYRPRPRRGETPRIIRPGFALAYVVRAVTPGNFTLPAVQVEDMYAPRIFARTAERSLRVQAAN